VAGVAAAFGWGWPQAALAGFLVALSSTAIVLKIMQQRAEMDSAHGRYTLAVLIFQDLAVVPMMLAVPFLARLAAGGTGEADGGSGLLLLSDRNTGMVLYKVRGEIFFASVDRFTCAFQPEGDRSVTIDVSRAHFWDISGVGALDKIVARLRRDGSEVNVIGYNAASADIVDRFAMHDKTGFELGAVPH
jgi:MFS superfamily sulfate permease-like transporter